LDEHVYSLNNEQECTYQQVQQSVENGDGKLIFLNGPGCTGKEYLYEKNVYKFQRENQMVVPVVSSGIAVIFLPEGQTADSIF
jgi:hypothetical protein